MADATKATREQFDALHPKASETLDGLSVDGAPPPAAISAEAVLEQLHSFPRGTAPGPSGLRAQHLLDALVPGEEFARRYLRCSP